MTSCQYCNQSFDNPRSRRSHEIACKRHHATHTTAAPLPHASNDNDAAAAPALNTTPTPSDTDFTNMPCPYCIKKKTVYKTIGNFRKHILSSHADKPKPAILTLWETTIGCVCSCNAMFINSKALQAHIDSANDRSQHDYTNKRLITCAHCPRVFTNPLSRRAHECNCSQRPAATTAPALPLTDLFAETNIDDLLSDPPASTTDTTVADPAITPPQETTDEEQLIDNEPTIHKESALHFLSSCPHLTNLRAKYEIQFLMSFYGDKFFYSIPFLVFMTEASQLSAPWPASLSNAISDAAARRNRLTASLRILDEIRMRQQPLPTDFATAEVSSQFASDYIPDGSGDSGF